MSVAERHLDSTFTPDDFEFVLEQVRAGNYADALQALARAKADDARNIFLIALEKQVTRLRMGGILPREKAEIIDSLPGLVERARQGYHSKPPAPEAVASQPTSAAPPAEKKDPRMKLVVDQYFRHADEWVRKRDFEAALKEIERILLVDPENRTAKEYQSRVQQLFRLEQGETPGSSLGDEMEEPAAESAVALGRPEEKKLGKLPVFLSIGIAVVVMVFFGIMMMRPNKGQYKVGYMYVSQSQTPAGEEQAAAVVTGDGEAGSVSGTASDEIPEATPPEPAKTKAATNAGGKPAVKEEKPVASKPANEEQVEAEAPKAEPPVSAPSRTVPPAPGPSAIGTSERSLNELSAPAKFIPVEEPPKILQLEQPSFSEEQIAQGVQGDVVVKVQIDKTGKPLQAKILSSTNASLNAAVVDAVMRSSFSPGVMSSGPVTTWMTIPLRLK
jgi:TonB family protein